MAGISDGDGAIGRGKRKGKTLSNADWKSPTDPDARIAKMKDGTTHLAYKPEHAIDLDTGVVVAAPIHPANEGDATTLLPTLDAAARNLDEVGLAPSARPASAVRWCPAGAAAAHRRDEIAETGSKPFTAFPRPLTRLKPRRRLRS